MNNATSPIKDDAAKTTTSPVTGSDAKKDEPNKTVPANNDKK